jgi:hypothetical protein
MTSPRKVAANRINGRKSRGPRTGAGKASASRNARRHGLAAFGSNNCPVMAEEIAQMVDAMCTSTDDPLLRQQAIMVAENQLWLSCIRAEKLAVVERLRDPFESAVTDKTVIARGKARFSVFDVAHPQLVAINAVIEKTYAAGGDAEREPVPPELEAAWPPAWVRPILDDAERDEYEALRRGIRDLVRLLRYEQRAWSRRKRAVRAFMAIKLTYHDRTART